MFELLIACLLSDLPELERLPGVRSVKVVVECDAPKLTIIHVRDWHLVAEAKFAIDVRDESDKPLSDSEVAALFEQHRKDVAAVQKQQRRVLRRLLPHLGIRQVFHEGFSADELPQYSKLIK